MFIGPQSFVYQPVEKVPFQGAGVALNCGAGCWDAGVCFTEGCDGFGTPRGGAAAGDVGFFGGVAEETHIFPDASR